MKKKGFSLVELLVTMAILGIISGFAAPKIWEKKEENDVKTETEKLKNEFLLLQKKARSELQITKMETKKEDHKLIKKTCEDKECKKEKKIEEYKFPTGIIVEEEFEITFMPPYGEIKTTKSPQEVTLKKGKEKRGISIYAESGLIKFSINKK